VAVRSRCAQAQIGAGARELVSASDRQTTKSIEKLTKEQMAGEFQALQTAKVPAEEMEEPDWRELPLQLQTPLGADGLPLSFWIDHGQAAMRPWWAEGDFPLSLRSVGSARP